MRIYSPAIMALSTSVSCCTARECLNPNAVLTAGQECWQDLIRDPNKKKFSRSRQEEPIMRLRRLADRPGRPPGAKTIGTVLRAACGGAVLTALTALPALADTVIHLGHVETVPAIVKIWQQAASDFESQHPGVKVKLDYLENEAYKAKLPT